jgi:hypothetical protein
VDRFKIAPIGWQLVPSGHHATAITTLMVSGCALLARTLVSLVAPSVTMTTQFAMSGKRGASVRGDTVLSCKRIARFLATLAISSIPLLRVT